MHGPPAAAAGVGKGEGDGGGENAGPVRTGPYYLFCAAKRHSLAGRAHTEV